MFKIARESDIDGNLFNAPEELKVVTINTVGAMGRGIALYVRENHREAYNIYMERHRGGTLLADEVWDVKLDNDVNIAMFPTKIHWREKSPPGLIHHNIVELRGLIEGEGYKSVAIPPLGLVNGWIRDPKTIREIVLTLYVTFKKTDIDAKLYCPDDLYDNIKNLFGVT
tara:strand:- start:1144 stop:1650 length:507 start_codon:yes stop_codon:yes gene_type:complete